MDIDALVQGLLMFLAFVGLVVLHEFAHAWTAVRCGDDTPRLQGRLTLDPLAHVDWIGTIALPLLLVFLGAAGGHPILFGWGRPVQVNLNNFRVRRRDDILVSGAGPAMNLLVTVVLLAAIKLLELMGSVSHQNSILLVAQLSLFLCFFNLLPIPPLDGGHIMRNLVGLSDEAYQAMSRFSFLFLLLVMRSAAVGDFVQLITNSALLMLARPFGWHLSFS